MKRSSTSRRFTPLLLLLIGTVLVLGARTSALDPPQAAPAAVRPGVQAQDAEFARLVKEWTTRPEFLSPLVDHLPKVDGVPSPVDVLGHHVGAPKTLTYYEDAVGYYRRLAAATRRVKVMSGGKTDEGRECVVVAIASEDTIAQLDQYRQYLAQLADPRQLSDAQAQAIVAKAKPIYHLTGGLHSAETGPPEMLMELAYRLAVEETPLIQAIRDNVIVTIVPVLEPDGRDRYVDWYYRHMVDITDENSRVSGPPYWGKYVLHDNNRDINYSQVTMRAWLAWYLDWHPPIIHDLHESVPFLYTFSGQAPQNPSLDPIVYGELPWFANFEMAQLTKYGMPGVWTHAFVDMWSPGYLGFMASNHNGMLRMYETYGNGGATTMKRTVEDEDSRRGSQATREWYRPLPPYKEVEWSIRNNTNYMETAVLSALQLTSAFPKVILDNFYRKSRNSIEAGTKGAPYAFVIPAGQRDMTRVAFIVNILRTQGIEVGRTTAEFTLKDETVPAGSYLVKLNQPYGRLAKILLEKQTFPDGDLRTYDDSGWTMGLHTHTEVKAVDDRSALDVTVEPVDRMKVAGTLAEEGPRVAYAIAHTGSANLITLRYRLRDVRIEVAEQAFTSGQQEFPAGSFLIQASQTDQTLHDRVKASVEDLGLTAAALTSLPAGPRHDADLPRLAVYSTWGSTQEVGWVRYALDQFSVPFDLIFKERVKQGNLRGSYDLIVIPSQSGNGKRLVYDVPSEKPLAYNKTEKFKSLGMYGESEDITGGMGLDGVLELQKFLDQGGVLATLGAATYFPPEFGLTQTINASRPSGQFYAPGPVVQADILQPTHPIFYGYPEKTVPVRYANGPLLDVPRQDRARQVLMRFPGGDKSLLSGLMKGADQIKDRPAIVQLPVGKGQLILFATNPCYRWQNLGEFNMLFNTIVNYNDLVPAADTPKTVQRR